MIVLDGFPLPPPPDGPPPPFPLESFFFLALGFGLLLALGWFLLVQAEIRRETTREQKERLAQQAVETQRETLIQWLIEQSPGGRKPWQERRTEEGKPCQSPARRNSR